MMKTDWWALLVAPGELGRLRACALPSGLDTATMWAPWVQAVPWCLWDHVPGVPWSGDIIRSNQLVFHGGRFIREPELSDTLFWNRSLVLSCSQYPVWCWQSRSRKIMAVIRRKRPVHTSQAAKIPDCPLFVCFHTCHANLSYCS